VKNIYGGKFLLIFVEFIFADLGKIRKN